MPTKKLLSRFLTTGTRLVILATMIMAAFISSVTPASAANTTIDLCATNGSIAMPATPAAISVAILGYVAGDCSTVSTTSAPGGPVITVNQGDVVTVNLHNNLGEASAILFQGQAMVPDTTGAAAGGTKTYTFVANTPGTFLYEAGLLPNAEHQSAMGLYGALIVRPTSAPDVVIPGQAYADAATTFVDEAVLVLSEIDPALNNSATPSTFDMRNYAPRYFLINGKSYPTTDPISSAAGNKVLLRYVNAGIQQHSMGVLGLRQIFVAKDASLLPTLNHNVAAESLAPGQTGDAIVTIPAEATTASKFAVYDGSLMLRNSNAAGFGGMLTFLTAGTGSTVTGPTTSAVALSPNPTNGSVSVALSASINSASSTVTAAEYFIDAMGANAAGTSMGGTFGSATVPVNAILSIVQLAALASGNHTIYVHGQDATGAWGTFSSAALKLDKMGPVTTGLTLTPNPSNGSVSVALSATGNDSTTGGSNIAAAEYTIDSGAAVSMNLGGAPALVRSLSATIPAGLSAGSHTIAVRSQDAFGNWGAYATITLNVVASGPITAGVSAAKNPNNGALPLNASQPVVRVTATMTSTGSTVSAAEGFIDTPPANTSVRGFPFVPSDGAFNSATETGYGDIPLATVNALSAGNHTIFVRGKDAAGNWGATAATVLLIDKIAPTFTSISLTPNPTYGAANVTLTVNGAADIGGAGVAGGEYWINPPTTTAPAPGSGTPFSGLTVNIPVGSLATGTYAVSARIRDAAFNWSTGTNGIRSATLTVVPDAIFSNGFEAGTRPWGWSSASTNTTTRLNRTATAALVGSFGLQAQGNNTNYVQYNFGTAANPASGTFDARFYFNPNGNTGTNQDIFVARTTGGTTVFRVRYRMSAGQSQVQIQVGTSTANATWTNLTNSASNRIEVVWQAVGSGGPNPGTLMLYVNGASSQTLTTTSTNSIGSVRLGSVTSGGNATIEYFDAFASKRTVSPLIGP
jgi:FtsP/CotA-like multicopper oxidase with cupredoxin domain